MLLCQRTHKTHLNYHLVAVELPFIHKVIDCMHQTVKTYLERKHSILLSVKASLHNLLSNRLYRVYSRLSNRLYNPVWQPAERTVAVRSTRLSNRLSNRFYNRFDNRLCRVNGILPTRSVYQVSHHSVGRCVKVGSCFSSSLEWKWMDSINGISYYLNKC